MDLREALSQLDTLNDDHWTGDGAPKIDAVKEILGGPVTRQDIINTAPHFSRENPLLEEPKVNEDGNQEPPVLDENVDLIDNFAVQKPMEIVQFLAFLATVPKGSLEDLLETLRQQQADVQVAQKELEEMQLRIRQATMHTKARIAREIPDVSDNEANRLYIQRQQEIRAAKHAATSALLKGVDPKMLDPRSMIDRAMARKNTRGANRPNFLSRG